MAQARGLPAAIYRPGMITGHSLTGAWNTSDFTCQMLKSWISAGYVPDLDASMDMTPVDYVSRAIVQLAGSEQSLGKVFHLANPRPVDIQGLYRWMRSFGYRLQPIYDEWRALVVLPGSGSGRRSLAPFSSRESEGR
jgi:thioester reductase-like protein